MQDPASLVVKGLCVVVWVFFFFFLSKKAEKNPTSQNRLFTFSLLHLVFLELSLGLCKLTRFLWPFGMVGCLPHVLLFLKFVNQASTAAISPGSSLAYVYFLVVEVCLGTCFRSCVWLGGLITPLKWHVVAWVDTRGWEGRWWVSTGFCIGMFMSWDGCTGATHVLRCLVWLWSILTVENKLEANYPVLETFVGKKCNEYLKGHNLVDCVWCRVVVSKFSFLEKVDQFLGAE